MFREKTGVGIFDRLNKTRIWFSALFDNTRIGLYFIVVTTGRLSPYNINVVVNDFLLDIGSGPPARIDKTCPLNII